MAEDTNKELKPIGAGRMYSQTPDCPFRSVPIVASHALNAKYSRNMSHTAQRLPASGNADSRSSKEVQKKKRKPRTRAAKPKPVRALFPLERTERY